MALATFPTLPGQGWSVKKTPTFSTRIAAHASGREVRAQMYAHNRYAFELTFDGLDSNGMNPGLQAQSLQTLMGFYIACQGAANPFLYVDPTDNAAVDAPFATGDGSTKTFLLYRPIGGTSEPVSYATNVVSVKAAGSVASGWSLIAPNIISFATAPAAGAALTWTGAFGFQCRFLDDNVEFENFMSGLWSVRGLKFQQVR